jgi:hypothetical protein
MTEQILPALAAKGLRLVAFAVSTIAFPACGGGVNVPDAGARTLADSAATMTESAGSLNLDRHVAGCPPSTPGTIAQSTCPEILIKVVGGRMLTQSDAVSTPPDDGDAILFAADGTFLYAEKHAGRIRRHAAMELDVRTEPSVANIEQYQWALYHQQPSPRHGPFVNRLKSVQEIGLTFLVPGTTPSYFASDGTGSGGTVGNTHGFNRPLSFLPNTALPITLLMFSTQTTESVCGQCWEVLWH